MMIMNIQYITDDNGEKTSVILPIEYYTQLLEELEDQQDVKLYDEVKARNEKSIPLSEYKEKNK
ncbi:MAG: hypothetical protein HZB41_03930 [Ignavibacteriae bacterium]|nr:hypothetical protein [Ignavibacteriota bacterium]